MDEGCNPYILLILIGILIVEAIIIYILYKKSKNEKVTEEEIVSMVNEGHESGNILASEATMIQNIFEFSDTDVKDIMVHRKNIVAIDSGLTLKETIEFVNDHHFSRYPVYKEELDDIIGIIHIKDILRLVENSNYFDIAISDIPDLLSPAESVPETHGINTLFAKMQNKKNHMIIVIDEYGQVSGILSMEDILEEIVGNIQDEHDEEDATIEQCGTNEFIMDGSTTLEEVEESLGILLSEDFETLNGYIISLLGKIPEDNSSFVVADDNFEYAVKNVSSKVIEEVVVHKIKVDEEESSDVKKD